MYMFHKEMQHRHRHEASSSKSTHKKHVERIVAAILGEGSKSIKQLNTPKLHRPLETTPYDSVDDETLTQVNKV
jgi:hypothetical protein